MKILFISANTEQINMATLPLGLACVAAATRAAGHETLLLDLLTEESPIDRITQTITAFQPEVIGISVRNIDDQQSAEPRFLLEPIKEIINVCKSLTPVPVVLGGAGYSIFPVRVLQYLGADFGVHGEGEYVFPALLDKLRNNEKVSTIPGLVILGKPSFIPLTEKPDMDSFPLPDSNLWLPPFLHEEERWMPVQTRRGCPMQCSYCSTSSIEGRITRKRSIAMVMKWLAHWQAAGFRNFFFVDNTFNLPLQYAKDLCRQILTELQEPLSWRCIIYPKVVDEELADLMAKSGCKQVALGFESGSNTILKSMGKGFSTADVRRVASILGEKGIARLGFLLLGGPGETKHTALESMQFADSLELEAMKITIGIRIYPKTKLAEMAWEHGIIGAEEDLLVPRFYLVPDLAEWLQETVQEWMASRPHWMK